MLLLLSLPSSSRGSTRLRLTTFCHRACWFSGWSTHSNIAMFLGVDDAIVKMISNIPVYRMFMLPM
jgi:hypothetical protein